MRSPADEEYDDRLTAYHESDQYEHDQWVESLLEQPSEVARPCAWCGHAGEHRLVEWRGKPCPTPGCACPYVPARDSSPALQKPPYREREETP